MRVENKSIEASLIGFILVFFLFLVSSSCSLFRVSVPKASKPLGDDVLIIDAVGYFDLTKGTIRGFEPINWYGGAYRAKISPDRKTVAYWTCKYKKVKERISDEPGAILETEESVDFQIWLMSLDGKKKTKLCNVDCELYFLRDDIKWSPDGKKVYLLYYGDVYSINTETGKRKEIEGFRGEVTEIAISPSGKRLAYDREGLYVCNLQDDKVSSDRFLFQRKPSPNMYSFLSLYPSIVWISEEDLLFIEQEEGTYVTESNDKPGELLSIEAPYRSTLWLVNADTGEKKVLYQTEPWEIIDELTISPTRDKVAFIYWVQYHGPIYLRRGYEPGHEPKPAIFDLKTGKLEKVPLPPEAKDWGFRNLSWSSP